MRVKIAPAVADTRMVPTHEDLPGDDAYWRSHAPARNRGNTVVGLLIAAIVTLLAADMIGSEPLYDLVTAIVVFMEAMPPSPWWLVYGLLTAIPLTLLHELGHALAARRLLDTPVDIVVGSFGALANVQLGRISITLNALSSPSGVDGFVEFGAARAGARDVVLIALAGPAASAAGLVACLVALAAAPPAGIVHDLLWAATADSVFAVLLNLIPFGFQERRGGPTLHTDGRVALDAAHALRMLR